MSKVAVFPVLLLLMIPGLAGAQSAASPAVKALEAAGLKTDNESLLHFLGPKVPAESTQAKQIAGLVEKLGAADSTTRDEAGKKLKALGFAARDSLYKATENQNLELAERAQDILDQITAPALTNNLLQVLAERKTPGAVPVLLERLPTLGAAAQEPGRRALAACAGPEDATVLQTALKADNLDTEFRAAILNAFFQISPKADPELLKSCLADPAKAIRKAGVYALYKAPLLDESFTPALVKLLTDDDMDLASRAAGFLAKINDPAAADALLSVMNRSPDYSFRSNVVDALVKMLGRKMAPRLIEILNEPGNPRILALGALARIHAPEAAEAVIGVLDDPDIHVRSQACLLLANYANAKAVEPLSRMVTGDPDPAVRRTAAYALARIGDPRATDALIELLTTDNYPNGTASTLAPTARSIMGPGHEMTPQEDAELYKQEARLEALTALGALGTPAALEAVFAATKPPRSPQVRGQAITLLAEAGDRRAMDLVLKGLTDANFFLASGAVQACKVLDDPRLLEPLIALAASERNAHIPVAVHELGGGSTRGGYGMESYIRMQALELLKDRWPREARPVLQGRLKDSDSFVAGRAAAWLAETKEMPAVPELVKMLDQEGNPYAKVSAAKALCKLKVKSVFDQCVEIVERTRDPSLAAEMGELAAESFVDQLVAELKNPSGKRFAAVSVLGYVKKPELADAIVPLLGDNTVAVRDAAIDALGRLKNPNAVAALVKLLQDATDAIAHIQASGSVAGARRISSQDGRVRLVAAALGNIGDKSAVEPLLAALDAFGKDQFTVGFIAKALGQIGDARAFEPLARMVRIYPQAAEGLALLGDPRALPYLQSAVEASSADLGLAKAIFKLQPAASVEALDKVLRNTHGVFDAPRVEAVELLAQVGSDQALASLRYALRDEGLAVRQAARKALASLLTPANAPRQEAATIPAARP